MNTKSKRENTCYINNPERFFKTIIWIVFLMHVILLAQMTYFIVLLPIHNCLFYRISVPLLHVPPSMHALGAAGVGDVASVGIVAPTSQNQDQFQHQLKERKRSHWLKTDLYILSSSRACNVYGASFYFVPIHFW